MKWLIRSVLVLLAVLLLVALIFRERLMDLYQQASPVEYTLDNTDVPLPSSQLPADSKWLSLFDGNSLAGWTVKFTGFEPGANHNNTFRAEDGVLKVDYSDWNEFDGQFGHLFTDDVYSRYLLRFEYRFIGEQITDDPRMAWATRNNGAMLHAQSPQSMSLDQQFPVSIEAQLLGGLGEEEGERPTANLCTPATNVVLSGEVYRAHCTESVSATYHGDQWVKAEFEVLGSERIRHFINGELVFEYTQPQYDPFSKDSAHLGRTDGLIDAGHIAFQAETHPTEFRAIEIYPLPGSTK